MVLNDRRDLGDQLDNSYRAARKTLQNIYLACQYWHDDKKSFV